jgi:hypothetical protein
VRQQQYETARAALSPQRFAPFSVAAWTAPPPRGQQPDPCIRWPAPMHGTEPVSGTAPGVPALVLSGDLDTDVTTEESRKVRSVFGAAQLVEVAGAGHLTAAGFDGACVQAVIQRFLVQLRPGDTRCARTPTFAYPAVGRFPRTVADAWPAASAGRRDESTLRDRRIAAVAAATVVDGIRRALIAGGPVAALRGGSMTGAFDASGPVVELTGARFAQDVPVTGSARVDFATGALTGEVTVPGGRLRVSGILFRSGAPDLLVDGRLGGRRVLASVVQ